MRRRQSWVGPTALWLKMRRAVGILIMCAGVVFVGAVAVTFRSAAVWEFAVSAALVSMFAFSQWRGARLAMDRGLIKEAQAQAETLPTGSAGAHAAQRALLPRLRHPGNRAISVGNLVMQLASEHDWASCAADLADAPRVCRIVLSDCVDGSRVRGLPRGARLELVSGWLRGLWPYQGARSLLVLCAAQGVLHHRERFGMSYSVGRRLYRIRREPFIAYNCACSLARDDNPEAAVRWLLRAVRAGYPIAPIFTDSDLASIRDDPRVLATCGDAPMTAAAAVPGPTLGPYLT